jgi:hypothetical protein
MYREKYKQCRDPEEEGRFRYQIHLSSGSETNFRVLDSFCFSTEA